MRVAVFTDNDFDKINGVTTTLRSLLRCAPADVQPRIYTFSGVGVEEPDYFALRSVGVPIPFYSEMQMYVPRMRALARQMAADGIDVVHLTTPGPAGLAARYLTRDGRLPLVGSFHTQLAEYTTALSGSRRLGDLMRLYMRWIYGGCRRVLVPSADTREHLIRNGWRADRLGVWARGVDTALFSPAKRSAALRESWHVCDTRPAILYAGRISIEKGLSMVGPLGSLLHRLGRSYRFIFVGDGPMLPALREACPDAVFTGRVRHEDVPALMASADVMFFPSETDTAGNVVLEAQACGLPVLVSDQGGPKENVRHGKSGYVCRAGDTLDFCARLSELLRDAELRRRLSEGARTYAQARPWAGSLEPLYSLYRAAARPGFDVAAVSGVAAGPDTMHGALPS
jgi:glycosyltransferase involved in cell wall biosynthesis